MTAPSIKKSGDSEATIVATSPAEPGRNPAHEAAIRQFIDCPWLLVMAPVAAGHRRPSARYETLNQPRVRPVRWLAYYVETRSPAMASAMAGSVQIQGHQAAVYAPEPIRPDQAGLLSQALRSHPDRRRHRLPRSH